MSFLKIFGSYSGFESESASLNEEDAKRQLLSNIRALAKTINPTLIVNPGNNAACYVITGALLGTTELLCTVHYDHSKGTYTIHEMAGHDDQGMPVINSTEGLRVGCYTELEALLQRVPTINHASDPSLRAA